MWTPASPQRRKLQYYFFRAADGSRRRQWCCSYWKYNTAPPLPALLHPDWFLAALCFSSQCNATCGEGVRRREVGCRGPGATPVQDDYCEPASQPPSQRLCKQTPCHFLWITGEWSEVGRRPAFIQLLPQVSTLLVASPITQTPRGGLESLAGLIIHVLGQWE